MYQCDFSLVHLEKIVSQIFIFISLNCFSKHIGREIEEKRIETEAVKSKARSLLLLESMTTSDQETIRNQIKILSNLWDDVLFQTRIKLRHLIELLENLEKYDELSMLLEDWMSTNESSLLRRFQVGGSVQKQREKIQSVKCYLMFLLLLFP